MLAVCFHYTGDMDAAHDVLHDGFIKIFTNFSFRGESSLCTWITRVMVTYNHWISCDRRSRSQPVVSAPEEQLPRYTGYIVVGRRSRDLRRAVDGFIAELPGWLPNRFPALCLKKIAQIDGKMLHDKEHSSTSQLQGQIFVSKKNKE